MTSPEKRPKKRRRGRPLEACKPAQPEDSLHRSQRLKEAFENSNSAVTRHLKLSPKCLYSVCSDVYKHRKIVARVCGKCQLDVLEAIYISRKQPELCIQTAYVRKLYVF